MPASFQEACGTPAPRQVGGHRNPFAARDRVARVRPLEFAVAAMLAAGCLGGSADDGGGTDLAATLGILRGVVVDEAIRPLAGANIRVDLADGTLRNATTGDDGLWAFADLPAGAYVVRTLRAGYLEERTFANVTAGVADPPAVRIVLLVDQRVVAAIDAYLFDGYLQCSVTAVAARQACDADEAVQPACGLGGGCPANLTEDAFMAVHTLGRAGMAYIQSEVVWDPSTSLGASLGAVPAARDATGALQDYAGVEGPSPLIVPFPGDVANALAIGNGRDYALRVFSGYAEGTAPPCLPSPAGCQWGVGATLQQRFTVVTHVFYGFVPPDGWQFGRDGLPPVPPT